MPKFLIPGRLSRFEELARNLSTEVEIAKKEIDCPLHWDERQAYAKALRAAIDGLNDARRILLAVQERITPKPKEVPYNVPKLTDEEYFALTDSARLLDGPPITSCMDSLTHDMRGG